MAHHVEGPHGLEQPGTQASDGPGGSHVRLIVPASTAHEHNTVLCAGASTNPPAAPPSKMVGSRALMREDESRSESSARGATTFHGVGPSSPKRSKACTSTPGSPSAPPPLAAKRALSFAATALGERGGGARARRMRTRRAVDHCARLRAWRAVRPGPWA
eukprot:5766268-Prymnesium_polylepis.1